MAQIFVFGRVMNDLVPKESQSKQSYVCFDLMERTKNWTQFYQVWAWDADVTRLMQFKVKKGSVIWLAGSQRLVDVRMKDGKLEKKLKVSLRLKWPWTTITSAKIPARAFTASSRRMAALQSLNGGSHSLKRNSRISCVLLPSPLHTAIGSPS